MTTKKSRGSVDAESFVEKLVGPLTLGKLLRSIRLCEEISQADFAVQLGVSKQNLSDIENDRRNVSAARAAEWAQKLGYGTAQFVRLALQAEVTAAGIELEVSVAAPKKKRAA